MDERIRKLEQQVAAQKAELAQLFQETHRATSGSGVVTGRCAQCDEGWIIKEDDCLVCRSCSYVSYL